MEFHGAGLRRNRGPYRHKGAAIVGIRDIPHAEGSGGVAWVQRGKRYLQIGEEIGHERQHGQNGLVMDIVSFELQHHVTGTDTVCGHGRTIGRVDARPAVGKVVFQKVIEIHRVRQRNQATVNTTAEERDIGRNGSVRECQDNTVRTLHVGRVAYIQRL